jgi:hypothetical protein
LSPCLAKNVRSPFKHPLLPALHLLAAVPRLLAPAVLKAQQSSSGNGAVTDQSVEVIPNAEVTVTNNPRILQLAGKFVF